MDTAIGSGLSAGRVQSVTTKMVVDREREIEKFTPEEYWTFAAQLTAKDGSAVEARLSESLTARRRSLKVRARQTR